MNPEETTDEINEDVVDDVTEKVEEEVTEETTARVKTIAIVVVGLLLLAVIVILLFIFLSKPALPTETHQSPITETPAKAQAEKSKRQELTGTVVSIDPAGEYIRVAVPGKGIYSVGIDTAAGEAVASSTLAGLVMSNITITAQELADTDRYDFMVTAEDLTRKTKTPTNKQTLPEKVKQYEARDSLF